MAAPEGEADALMAICLHPKNRPGSNLSQEMDFVNSPEQGRRLCDSWPTAVHLPSVFIFFLTFGSDDPYYFANG